MRAWATLKSVAEGVGAGGGAWRRFRRANEKPNIAVDS